VRKRIRLGSACFAQIGTISIMDIAGQWVCSAARTTERMGNAQPAMMGILCWEGHAWATTTEDPTPTNRNRAPRTTTSNLATTSNLWADRGTSRTAVPSRIELLINLLFYYLSTPLL
jgi:hypothetical protein